MIKVTAPLAALALLLATAPVVAQSPPPAPAPSAPAAKVAVPLNTFFRAQSPTQTLASDRLLGAKVIGRDGRIIGTIDDLILSADNRIEGVVIGVGGLLGVGDKKVGVRYGALQFSSKDGAIQIALPTVTKEILAVVPALERQVPKKSLATRARETAKQLGEQAQDAAAVAKEKSGPALEKAKEAGKAAIEKGKELIEQTKEKTASPTPTPAPAPQK